MSDAKPFIRLNTFKGRLGNQLFQYAYARIQADRQGCDLEVPRWHGEQLFDIPSHPLTDRMPSATVEVSAGGPHPTRFDVDLRNMSVSGYFQFQTSNFSPYAEQWRKWFTPKPSLITSPEQSVNRLKAAGRTMVGMHIRRGDFGYRWFYKTPCRWYKDWLESWWTTLNEPLLFIATDAPWTVSEFEKWKPVCHLSSGAEIQDHYVLRQCSILLIPNSTFSLTAAMIGRPDQVFRSSLPHRRFDPIDPWNTEPLQRDLIADYPPT